MRDMAKATIVTAVLAATTLLTPSWSEERGVSLSVEGAQARVGHPMTPVSGAGVVRRQHRRAVYGAGAVGAGLAGAAAIGTAAAIAASPYYAGAGYYGGSPYYGSTGYYAGGPYPAVGAFASDPWPAANAYYGGAYATGPYTANAYYGGPYAAEGAYVGGPKSPFWRGRYGW